jgi:hypothetical protein
MALEIAKPPGSTGRNKRIVEALGKRFALTAGVEASKPSRRHMDCYHSPVRRQITKLTPVVAMDAARR